MSNIWHDINPRRISPEKFMAVIEIPKGVKNKYEMDKETGLLRLDRVLYTSTHYPANYGFIPRTYAADNDPLDVLVLCQESIVPMTLVECYPIGVMKMIDDDQVDEKILQFRLMTRHMRNLRILTNYLNILSVKFLTSSECINLLRVRKLL